MKKVLILLTVLALAASPAMASTKLEATSGKKHLQTTKHHAVTKKEKKQAKKKQAKKLAKRNARKHKVAV